MLLLAGLGLVPAVVLVLTAVTGFQTQQRANRLSAAATQLTSRVMEAKFRSADVAGWQTDYAFDFVRGVPGALSDSVGRRKGSCLAGCPAGCLAVCLAVCLAGDEAHPAR